MNDVDDVDVVDGVPPALAAQDDVPSAYSLH